MWGPLGVYIYERELVREEKGGKEGRRESEGMRERERMWKPEFDIRYLCPKLYVIFDTRSLAALELTNLARLTNLKALRTYPSPYIQP